MRFFSVLFFAMFIGLQSGTTSAQNIMDYATVAPAEDWVILQDITSAPETIETAGGVRYLLADYQAKEMVDGRMRYERYVDQLVTETAVEENSTITIQFDPSFQTVILHSVQIIRDGVAMDRLDLTDFQVYRFESDRDRLIFNGDLEMAYIVPDVRAGDILDHSYTIVGRNPAFGPHFVDGLRHGYGVEVGRISNRILIQDGLDYQLMTHQNAADPDTIQANGFTALSWAEDNVASVEAEDERPYWHYAYPYTSVSSFGSWAMAGQHLADAYDPVQFRTEEISSIAANIAAQHEDKEDQLRAALDFVQRNIRYLGIELGAGGYIPRSPELVLSRRYGDCKDVTLLLATILDALDIKAAVLLVNTEDGYGLSESLPSIGAFDHVIVSAWLGEEQHFLDATLDAQLGDFAHMEQADYGYGVIVSPDSTGLIRASGRGPAYSRDFLDTFDLRAEGSEVLYTSKSTYRGFEAERMNAWVEDRGKSVVAENFLSYFEGYFPTIEQYGPFLITLNEEKAELTITGFYRIPDAWTEDTDQNEMQFTAFASELTADLPDVESGEDARQSPYAIPHSIRTRQIIDVRYPENWDMQAGEETISLPSIEYTETRSVEGQIYRNVFTLESISNRIEAEDFEETLAAHETIREDAEVTFWYSIGEAASN